MKVYNAQLATSSTTLPLMDGTASVGTEQTYARGDHVHPTDTSRVALTTFNELAEPYNKYFWHGDSTGLGTGSGFRAFNNDGYSFLIWATAVGNIRRDTFDSNGDVVPNANVYVPWFPTGDAPYYVGSLYTSATNVNPGTNLGGAWVLKGKMPYVVESGTSGIWHYRKWSDGTAELWGTSTGGTSAFGTANVSYSSNHVNYPFTFTSVPVVTIGAIDSSAGVCSGEVDNTTTTGADVRVIGPAWSSYSINVYVVGTWRTTAEYMYIWQKTA